MRGGGEGREHKMNGRQRKTYSIIHTMCISYIYTHTHKFTHLNIIGKPITVWICVLTYKEN